MKVLATFLLALVLHLVLGWAWTVAAGVVGGFWAVRGGWAVGAAGVGAGWMALLLYNYAVAAPALRAMPDVMGGLLGNLPGFVVVVISLGLGAALGALGGLIGSRLALLLRSRAAAPTSP